jgi:hypothetical protein
MNVALLRFELIVCFKRLQIYTTFQSLPNFFYEDCVYFNLSLSSIKPERLNTQKIYPFSRPFQMQTNLTTHLFKPRLLIFFSCTRS